MKDDPRSTKKISKTEVKELLGFAIDDMNNNSTTMVNRKKLLWQMRWHSKYYKEITNDVNSLCRNKNDKYINKRQLIKLFCSNFSNASSVNFLRIYKKYYNRLQFI